jgi:hypothetical protein
LKRALTRFAAVRPANAGQAPVSPAANAGQARPAHGGQARPANAGQATVEYILLLSFVVVACVGMTRAILGGIDRGVLRVGGGLEKQLKTGRAPGGIWSN